MATKLQGQCDIHHTTEITVELCSFYFVITMSPLLRKSRVQVQAQAKFFLFSLFLHLVQKSKSEKKTKKNPSALRKVLSQNTAKLPSSEVGTKNCSSRRSTLNSTEGETLPTNLSEFLVSNEHVCVCLLSFQVTSLVVIGTPE